MWLYRRTISGEFEIGYLKFDQDNSIQNAKLKQMFIIIDICKTREEAEKRVHYLNGGN